MCLGFFSSWNWLTSSQVQSTTPLNPSTLPETARRVIYQSASRPDQKASRPGKYGGRDRIESGTERAVKFGAVWSKLEKGVIVDFYEFCGIRLMDRKHLRRPYHTYSSFSPSHLPTRRMLPPRQLSENKLNPLPRSFHPVNRHLSQLLALHEPFSVKRQHIIPIGKEKENQKQIC